MELKIQKLINLFNDLENGLPVSDFKDIILASHPFEIAEALSTTDEDFRFRFYSLFSAKDLAPIFEHMDEKRASDDLVKLKIRFGAQILENMALDDAADILQEITDLLTRTKYLNMINTDIASELKAILQYDTEVVGSIMLPSFIKIKIDQTIKEASKVLVQEAVDTEFISYLYVLDDDRLVGVISLKELITSERMAPIKEVMNSKLIVLNVNDSKEKAIRLSQNYDLTALPVVDDDGDMLGIVTHDDIIDVIDEATNEDFAFLGGIGDGEIHLENERLSIIVKNRLPWLLILLLIGLITSSIMTGFEDIISSIPILVMFLPVISDMAGNVGTQSLVTTISMISSKQLIRKKDRRAHVRREFGVVILNAIVLSLLSFVLVLLFFVISKASFTISLLKTSIVISGSLGATLIISNLAGAIIPLVISRFKIDPATASGPLITTINDIFSTIIYFTLAALILKG